MHYGSHFEKKALKDCFILDMFTLATGGLELAKIQNVFMGNKLDKSVRQAGVL